MAATPSPSPRPAGVEVFVSSLWFSGAEHVTFADDKAARAFARDVMQFAVTGGHGRRRTKAAHRRSHSVAARAAVVSATNGITQDTPSASYDSYAAAERDSQVVVASWGSVGRAGGI
jgi:hypothetical protein